MGLDMYLKGKKFIWSTRRGEEQATEDGYPVRERVLALGYWRKHPDLHGFIVNTFAGGKDDCQEIELSAEDLGVILAAVRAKRLPETSGFFFGKSDGSEDTETVDILERALAWMKTETDPSVSRYVVYQASW